MGILEGLIPSGSAMGRGQWAASGGAQEEVEADLELSRCQESCRGTFHEGL